MPSAALTAEERRWFDEQMEQVVAELPPSVQAIIEEVPLIVEDYPSRRIMREEGLTEPDELCGLYCGAPLTEPEERDHRLHPDLIMIYRAGILSQAADDDGVVTDDNLRREIRITILHEVGHHHGLSEEDLRDVGYD